MLDPRDPVLAIYPKEDEDRRVASCILSPNMLDNYGLNREIKCPPPEIL